MQAGKSVYISAKHSLLRLNMYQMLGFLSQSKRLVDSQQLSQHQTSLFPITIDYLTLPFSLLGLFRSDWQCYIVGSWTVSCADMWMHG